MMRLGTHPRYLERPALVDDKGQALCTWATDETRENIAAILERGGYVLHDDNTVTKRGEP